MNLIFFQSLSVLDTGGVRKTNSSDYLTLVKGGRAGKNEVMA